jgi:hypothetical protein
MSQYLGQTSINPATRINIAFHNPPVLFNIVANSAVAAER